MSVGFYGKLPSHGDFLSRRVSEAFIDPWDAWLRDSLAASHAALGPQWLDVYLTSPAWRFVCAAGVCGPAPVAGVLAPSVDRVGRYFPLTIVTELPTDTRLLPAAAEFTRFFDGAERLVIETLAAEHVDFERFDVGVSLLEEELVGLRRPMRAMLDPVVSAVLQQPADAWQVPIGAAAQLGSTLGQLLSLQLESHYRPLVLWWTDGSGVVEPSCLVLKGLPTPELFPAFLNGAFSEAGWKCAPARIAAITPPESLVDEGQPLSFRSVAATDVGCARGNNEDGFIDRPDIGLWAVADGMGGHSHGEVASRMICDALQDFQPAGSFDEAIERASERVRQVNDYLLRTAAGSEPADRSGSTVAMLFLRGTRSAVLWAGDSRVYRWRAGRLDQLSRDHSLAALEGSDASKSSVITRAVGVQPDLTLDLHRDTVLPEDRFLLCSDGLTRVIPDVQISAWMQAEDIRTAVNGLIKETLAAGAPDNVTVVVAEAYA